MRTESCYVVRIARTRSSSLPLACVNELVCVLNTHTESVFLCLHVCSCIRIPRRHSCIYVHDSSSTVFVSVACVRLFTCAHVSTRTHTRARALTPDRSRHRTIFERGKERSRTNFLHNFGSPRADSNSHYYTKPRGSEQRSLCFARRGFPRSASIARACNSAAR